MEDKRFAWFNEARFGMFIHWGAYSVPARGEWLMLVEKIPPTEYRRFAEDFRAENYDPETWARMAKQAGMRYMVLTTRHHDGYSLFDSKLSDFTSVKIGPERDLIAPYVDACRRAGLGVGFYYSLLDWRWKAYFDGPKADPGAWKEFVDYMHAQVRELMTNYGKIDILWYDGNWPHSAEDWRSEELNQMVRQLQPHILINNRSGLPADLDTPEQHITASLAGRAWESCMTMNDSWGYHRGDENWKSARNLVFQLVTCAAGGGNYLLNVGPKADGTFPEESVARLEAVGKWVAQNGKSVYDIERVDFGGSQAGPFTQKANILYAHLFRWPGKEFSIGGLKTRAKRAYLLATGEDLKMEQRDYRLFISGLSEARRDPYDTVIAIQLDGELEAHDQGCLLS